MTHCLTNVRVLAVDDAPFAHRPRARVLLIGVLSRGAQHIEGVYSTSVVRDGWRATDAIVRMVSDHRLALQARFILLDGIAVGGFNVVDLPALSQRTGLGAIAVMRKLPDMAAIQRALQKIPGGTLRMEIIARAGTIYPTASNKLYFQCAGCSPDKAQAVLAAVTCQGNYPEPLRVAHLIGAGVVLGRSRSRA